jgi:dUTPase
MNIKFSKIRNVKSPEFGTTGSAGIDFFVPEFDEDFIHEYMKQNTNFYSRAPFRLVLFKGTRVKIPSGIRVNLPEDVCLIAFNKSGVSFNKGLDKLSEVIDPDYQGEIYIVLQNSSEDIIEICPGEKIIQFVPLPKLCIKLKEMDIGELYTEKTERGGKGFGSTGV